MQQDYLFNTKEINIVDKVLLSTTVRFQHE